MSTFRDKICIVTGGASGIGRSLCGALAQQEARVIMVDINYEQLEKEAQSRLEKNRLRSKTIKKPVCCLQLGCYWDSGRCFVGWVVG